MGVELAGAKSIHTGGVQTVDATTDLRISGSFLVEVSESGFRNTLNYVILSRAEAKDHMGPADRDLHTVATEHSSPEEESDVSFPWRGVQWIWSGDVSLEQLDSTTSWREVNESRVVVTTMFVMYSLVCLKTHPHFSCACPCCFSCSPALLQLLARTASVARPHCFSCYASLWHVRIQKRWRRELIEGKERVKEKENSEEKKKMVEQTRRGEEKRKEELREEKKKVEEISAGPLKNMKEAEEFVRLRCSKDGRVNKENLGEIIDNVSELIRESLYKEGKINRQEAEEID
uniref:Uncharacterized protein n=1 Tax=Timema bartmani TaxID=61472 RepID=A0A7R9F4I0_9NEOP|nr:unnamed protein product [Timema bartmani]